jgi:hypothetical protein
VITQEELELQRRRGENFFFFGLGIATAAILSGFTMMLSSWCQCAN